MAYPPSAQNAPGHFQSAHHDYHAQQEGDVSKSIGANASWKLWADRDYRRAAGKATLARSDAP